MANINGTPGNDELEGTGQDDVLSGLGGDDVIRGRRGNDRVDGGEGIDFISFAGDGVTGGISFNFSAGSTNDGIGGLDTFVNVEGVIGTSFADTMVGGEAGERFRGGDGDDSISGGGGRDRLAGGSGNDTLDGGEGRDVTIFGGTRVSVTVGLNAEGRPATASGGDGADTLVDIERLAFSDSVLAFDFEGNAGQGYRLYQAAFDRVPDTVGLSFWVNALDEGVVLPDVASGFIASSEFQGLYGANPSSEQFINALYGNVLDRDADQGGYDYWLGVMSAGASRADVLVAFSESGENKANVIGSIQNGIVLDLV